MQITPEKKGEAEAVDKGDSKWGIFLTVMCFAVLLLEDGKWIASYMIVYKLQSSSCSNTDDFDWQVGGVLPYSRRLWGIQRITPSAVPEQPSGQTERDRYEFIQSCPAYTRVRQTWTLCPQYTQSKVLSHCFLRNKKTLKTTDRLPGTTVLWAMFRWLCM